MTTFKTFNTSAVIRLEAYRKSAALRNEHLKKHFEGQTTYTVPAVNTNLNWRECRYPKPAVLAQSSIIRSQDNTKFFVVSLEDFPGNMEGDAHEIIRLRHTGWYSDNFEDGLIRGAVISMRNPHETDEDGSHKQYMPATYGSEWDGATVYNEFYDDKEEAARAADKYAEREAEASREDGAKYLAEQQTAELKEQIHAINKETIALIKEIKSSYTPSHYPSICRTLRRAIEKALDDRRKAFERIEALKENYWLVVE